MQEGSKFLCGKGFAEQVPLYFITSHIPQKVKLLLCLNAFGHCFQIKALSQRKDHFDNHCRILIMGYIGAVRESRILCASLTAAGYLD